MHEVSQDHKLNSHRVGSDEAKENLKQLGADEVYTESQLDVKNVRGLLVSVNNHFKLIITCALCCLCSAISTGHFPIHFCFPSDYPPFFNPTHLQCVGTMF